MRGGGYYHWVQPHAAAWATYQKNLALHQWQLDDAGHGAEAESSVFGGDGSVDGGMGLQQENYAKFLHFLVLESFQVSLIKLFKKKKVLILPMIIDYQ